MHRLLEILLGLDKDFLTRQGERMWQFNPAWPFQKALEPVGGASFYNLIIILMGLALIVYVYRHEGKSLVLRISLAVMRVLLLAVVLILLNRPVLVLGTERKEPSVVAVLVDDTISMSVPDMPNSLGPRPLSRMAAVQELLTGSDAELLRTLGKTHNIRIYRFGRDAQNVATILGSQDGPAAKPQGSAGGATTRPSDGISEAVRGIEAIGAKEEGTQVIQSLHTVLDELQGQRLAGIVLLTDGHDTPVRERPEIINEIRTSFNNVPIYPVAVGQDRMPRNIEVLKPEYEPSVFLDDFTVVKFGVRATGFEPGHRVHVSLKTKDGKPALDDRGLPIGADVTLPDDHIVQVELPFMPALVLGMDLRHLPKQLPPEDKTLQLVVEADKQTDVFNEADMSQAVSVEVLDTGINILFVDGYPRWEYRYIKSSLVRDKTMKVNCLLTSADTTFTQEASDGTTPIKQFPTTIEQLLQFDVVLFGDVDQHQFTDAQLQLISDFVSKKGGGFGMIAGPRYSPQSYKNTPVQPILPVDITRSDADDSKTPITQGFRPMVTTDGMDSSIFRFFHDKLDDKENQAADKEYVEKGSPELFWYCHNVVARPQATVLSQHPTDNLPGSPKKSPLLVVSQFGAGRTLFSAVDDSWRWRFFKGEEIFNTYWVQQVRYLARNKKLDERKVMFEPAQKEYQLGQQVSLDLRVLSPELSQKLSPQIPVEILDDKGQPVKGVTLNREENSDKYTVSWTADSVGQFTARLPPMGEGPAVDRTFVVKVPQLELESPQVDRSLLSALGQPVDFDKARTELPLLIHSAAKTIRNETPRPLWDAPLAMVLFITLITIEWILRKVNGML